MRLNLRLYTAEENRRMCARVLDGTSRSSGDNACGNNTRMISLWWKDWLAVPILIGFFSCFFSYVFSCFTYVKDQNKMLVRLAHMPCRNVAIRLSITESNDLKDTDEKRVSL